MAGSALPGLRSVKLDNHVYLDGGIGDNFPYYLPVGDYQHLLAFFDDGVMPGLEQAALLYEMRRDRVYTAEKFLRTLSGCREKAQKQYEVERKNRCRTVFWLP